MDELVACPDCGTTNRPGADLCAQCWRALNEDALSRIPVVALTAPAPAPPPPPAPRPVLRQPKPRPEPAAPREATPGPVPYFAGAGSAPSVSLGFPLPAQPSSAPAQTRSVPWGLAVLVAVVVALGFLGANVFVGGSDAFSPEDGAYSVTLPDGWVEIEELKGLQPQIDRAIRTESNQAAIMVGHWPMPVGATKEQLGAGMNFAQQYMPRFPGVTMGSFAESTAVSGEGVFAYEMTATASGAGGLVPGGNGRMRMVFAAREGAPNFVLVVVACAEAECAAADAAFEKMAKTLEISA